VSLRLAPDRRAHRVAWILANGPIPPGLFVCHRCDNPPCCNPAHLFLGTPGDNARDRNRKGRHGQPVGESNPYSRLTNAAVREIRRQVAAGRSQRAIGHDFGISQVMVCHIVKGRHWAHV
jgi:hypothetical protein